MSETVDNKVTVLVLQHPQEQDHALGTAGLLCRTLASARLAVGLSWRKLGHALGEPAEARDWGVLYLGSAHAVGQGPLIAVDRKGETLPNQEMALSGLKGLVVLDGNWAQAKALWWRNAWMLKMRRIALNPRRASRYGKLRKEPRRDGLSTLEAAGMALSRLENKPEIETALINSFEKLLTRYRAFRAASKAS